VREIWRRSRSPSRAGVDAGDEWLVSLCRSYQVGSGVVPTHAHRSMTARLVPALEVDRQLAAVANAATMPAYGKSTPGWETWQKRRKACWLRAPESWTASRRCVRGARQR
jgi:hypothetical protein